MNPSPLSAQAPSSEQQAPAPDQAAASASAQLLDQLLKLADDYRAERGVRQAMETLAAVNEPTGFAAAAMAACNTIAASWGCERVGLPLLEAAPEVEIEEGEQAEAADEEAPDEGEE